MIKGIDHKGLRLLWEKGKSKGLPAKLVSRIERMLVVLDTAKEVPGAFQAFRNWNIHELAGDLQGFWSLKVNKNYRLIFKFDGGHALDVNFLDYH